MQHRLVDFFIVLVAFANRNGEIGFAQAEGRDVEVNRRLAVSEFLAHEGEGVSVCDDTFDFSRMKILKGFGNAFVFMWGDSDAGEDVR